MVEIGKTQTLFVNRAIESGFYLDGENFGEVLLSAKYAPDNLTSGDSLRVFLYHNSEGEIVATTQTPKAQAGEFALLEVMGTTGIGAFLNFGLDKDVLVPNVEQQIEMEVGKSYLVHVFIDSKNGRLKASSNIERFLEDDKPHTFNAQDPVNLIIAKSTDLGYKAIINQTHWGVLYKNEVHQRLNPGQSIQGYIKNIRDDRKIDLTLHLGENPSLDQNAFIIESYLKGHEGFAPVHDKSDPKQINELFKMSKGSFKDAIGRLYKQKIIKIEKNGIYLILEKNE